MITYNDSDYAEPSILQSPAFQIFLSAIFIAITAFCWQFWTLYHDQLNKYMFYLLTILVFLISILAFAGTCYICAMLFFKAKERAVEISRVNNETILYSAASEQIKANQVYLSRQRTDNGLVEFKHLPKPAKLGMNSSDVLPELELMTEQPQEIKDSLLTDISRDMNILVIAPKQGAGKTTLLGHIATQRLNKGEIVKVFDPHYEQNKNCWDSRCEVFGAGRDYDEIKAGLDDLLQEMDKRFKHNISSPKITFFMDEMKTVCEKVGASDYFAEFLTEGRKAGIQFVGAGHSTRVKALGLEGMGDLFLGFDSILYLNKNEFKIRRAVFDEHGNEINSLYHHPGKLEYFHADKKANDLLPNDFNASLKKIIETPLQLDKKDRIVKAYLELKQEGKTPISKNDIALKVYGGKCNGLRSKEIQDVLESANIHLS